MGILPNHRHEAAEMQQVSTVGVYAVLADRASFLQFPQNHPAAPVEVHSGVTTAKVPHSAHIAWCRTRETCGNSLKKVGVTLGDTCRNLSLEKSLEPLRE